MNSVPAETGEGAASPLLVRRPPRNLDSYERLIVVSPGKDGEDLKAQDRALVVVAEDGRSPKRLMAIVCDGVSQSPSSAEAAEYVSSSVDLLYRENGVRQVSGGLFQKREALMKLPIKLEYDAAPVLKTMLEEIVVAKRARSFQTTFIAAAVDINEELSNELRISILGCGDSCVFIFTDRGKLLYNSLGVTDEDDGLEHLSVVTHALPDSLDETESKILADAQLFDAQVNLLLCSDGFYDSFDTFNDIFFWLTQNLTQLKRQDKRSLLMSELHAALGRKTGDDDISFIWLRPLNEPADTEVDPVDTTLGQCRDALSGANSSLELSFTKRGLLSKVRRLLSIKARDLKDSDG